MKVTATVPIVRAEQERELAVTSESDDELLTVFVPPAARQASAVFQMTREALADLAAQFAPPSEPVAAVPSDLMAALERIDQSNRDPETQQIPGQTNVYDYIGDETAT